MRFISRGWAALLVVSGWVVGGAEVARANVPDYVQGDSTSNCTFAFGTNLTFQVDSSGKPRGWAFCSETPTTTTFVPIGSTGFAVYDRWYEEIAGLWTASASQCPANGPICNRNIRICVRNRLTGEPVQNFAVPEAKGARTGPRGCAVISGTAFNCGTPMAGTCCATEEDCPAPKVSIAVTGPGRVKSKPIGIDCRSADPTSVGCSTRFAGGNWVVSLTATPDAKGVFSGWTGASNCAPDRYCDVRMDQGNRSLTATFVDRQCTTDADCRLYNCDCTCVVLPRGQTCNVTTAKDCGGDPCAGKKKGCVNGVCRVR